MNSGIAKKGRINLGFIAFFISFAADFIFAQDFSRYPRDSFTHTGEFLDAISTTHREVMPMQIEVRTDPTFTPAQKEMIKKAARIFIARALESYTMECAFSHSKRDQPTSPEKLEEQLYLALAVRYGPQWFFFPASLFIAKYTWDPYSVGQAYFKLFYDQKNALPWHSDKHYLHIALNADWLAHNASFRYGTDAYYWAGVIGHEVLHNLGYNHVNAKDDLRGYEESFVKAYGDCIRWGGLVPQIEPALTLNNETFKEMPVD